ncbi:MAG: hypothetical protein QOF14_303 [Hyphomicrobiales bacterium]|jgi:hypothetical protein|nr:hypothetical protein [Hyphomicrobiales bacterium]
MTPSNSTAKAAGSERAKPFSIRLTENERAGLQARAGGVPLGVFIRNALLAESTERRERKSPLKDADALGRLLGLLGQSEIGASLRQLAAQANAGTLYCDERTTARLRAACDDVRAMRLLLLEALGKAVLNDVLSNTFASSAASSEPQP